MKAIPTNVMIRFGEWCVLTECQSIRQAISVLRWQKERTSWPLKLQRT